VPGAARNLKLLSAALLFASWFTTASGHAEEEDASRPVARSVGGGTAKTAAKGVAGVATSAGAGGSGAVAGSTTAIVVAPPPVDPGTPSRISSGFESEPVDAVRGGIVTVNVVGEQLPTDPTASTVWLDELALGHPTAVGADGKSFVFVVPVQGLLDNEKQHSQPIEARHYTLRASFKAGSEVRKISLGVVRITPEKLPPLSLDNVTPTIVYPDQQVIVLSGDGFGGRLRDYALLVDAVELPLCEDASEASRLQPPQRCVPAHFTSDHQLEVGYDHVKAGLGTALTGDHKLALRAGDHTSSKAILVAFSPYTVGAIRQIAAFVTALLVAGIVALTLFGGGPHRIGQQRHLANAFLIDTETDTYSLGKFQAYLWLVAALAGYLYLALSRSLVQGKMGIVDMPDNLINILGLSLGTAIGSVGITRLRGPKASGGVQPNVADLITTGGVVSPERVGMLVWTVVAVLVFIMNVWQVNPMVLDALPKVPDGLLALSGLTSAGYLGGKLVRGPGPVVDEVMLSRSNESWDILLTGRNLGTDASFEVDGQSITSLFEHADKRSVVVTPEDARDGRFAKSVRLVLRALPDAWATSVAQGGPPGGAELTIVNSDGQRASGVVQLPAATEASA
jgi:hypothetical protein